MRLIWVAAAWVLGISLARASLQFDLSIWLVCLAVSIGIAINYRHHRRRWLILALAAFFAGAARQALLPQSSDISQYNGRVGALIGIVTREPDIRDNRIQLRVETESIRIAGQTTPTSGQVLVEAFVTTEVSYGDRIRATGRLDRPAAWDTFSYADYLGRQGVFTIMPFASVKVIGGGYGQPFYAALLNLKRAAQENIAQALPEPQAGLLTGMLLGNERGISPELAEDFNRAGAAHIVAISGFNMIVISAIVMRVLEGVFGGRRGLAVVCGLIFIAIYTLFVGASPSIMRAALMSGLLVVSRRLNRQAYMPTSLALAALLLSIVDPNVLLDVGFQLSFLAVLGLGLFADPLSRFLRARLDGLFAPPLAHGLHIFLNEPLAVSLAAQLATTPLIILYFDRLSLTALPVNLLIMPMQSLLLILGLLAVMTAPLLPLLGALIYWMDMVFLSWTIAIVRGFARLDFADLTLNMDGRLIQIFYLLMIGGAMANAARPSFWRRLEKLIRGQAALSATALSASLILILMLAMRLSYADGHLHIWLLDVGHSNGILLQTPKGAHMLVDGGRFPSRLLTAIGDRLPFYDRRIEILAITHPDERDIAALSAVLQRYEIGAALYSGQPNETETFLQIAEQLRHSKTEIVEARAGYTMALDDGVFIETLHPQARPALTDSLNDHAMTLRIAYGDVSFLLTSDLSRAGQRLMLANDIHPLASVMQIPQHGSRHALEAEFLERVQPQAALLQSDAANRRGDPDPDTLALFEGLPLFRTDEGGVIHVKSDGQQVWISQDG